MRRKFMFNNNESLKKITHSFIKPNIEKKDILVDEIYGEQKIYGNQGVKKTVYKFEDGKAISCFNTEEFYDESFQKIMLEFYEQQQKDLKNMKCAGNIITFEWSDEFFKQKGKGSTPYEIEKFLKNQKYKVEVKFKKEI